MDSSTQSRTSQLVGRGRWMSLLLLLLAALLALIPGSQALGTRGSAAILTNDGDRGDHTTALKEVMMGTSPRAQLEWLVNDVLQRDPLVIHTGEVATHCSILAMPDHLDFLEEVVKRVTGSLTMGEITNEEDHEITARLVDSGNSDFVYVVQLRTGKNWIFPYIKYISFQQEGGTYRVAWAIPGPW